MKRWIFLGLGWIFMGLGAVGLVLPVMPTTPFLLVALACFSRSSPRLEAWLLNHRLLGPPLRGWRERGAIPLYAKLMALGGCASGFAIFLFATDPTPLRIALVGGLMLSGLAYVFTRPSA